MQISLGVLAAYVVAAGVLALLWLLIGALLGLDWPIRAIDGFDKRPSTSKFQFLLWTAITLGAFVALFVRHLTSGSGPPTSIGIPGNLFLLMGISTGSAVVAKIITSTNPDKSMGDDAERKHLKWLFMDDADQPAVEKIQVMAWTLVAVAVYVVSLAAVLSASRLPTSLPNVPDSLLVLMGISHVGYLAPKAVGAATARRRGRAAPAVAAPVAPAVAPSATPASAPSAPPPAAPSAPPIVDSL